MADFCPAEEGYPSDLESKTSFSTKNADGRIMPVAYRVDGNSFAPGPPKLWPGEQIPGRSGPSHAPWNLDIAPDQKRFAVFPVGDDEIANALPAVLLVNFFDEIGRRIHR